ncbi:MAG: FAD-binding protein [Clostridia bacterium]|nr:FAD-binding protein [Clostridia bacterium]
MINIVGAGLAGLSAAISLGERGIRCNLISLSPSERAQSVLAEGGINAALNTMNEDDSTDQHFKDTIIGGVYLADENAVYDLVNGAESIIKRLSSIGVPFENEKGRILLRSFGGQKKRRTAFVKSSTGKAIMTALIDEARKYEAKGLIKRYCNHRATELLIENKACKGIKIVDVYGGNALTLKGAVILASGGFTGMFEGFATGSIQNDGDLVADGFLKGLRLSNLEFIQYHPTAVQIADKPMLISEAARGEGARLFTVKNGEPWYFMEDFPLKDLMPRDIVAREITRVLSDNTCSRVYLDMRSIDKKAWEHRLFDLQRELIDYLGINPAKEPVEINPAIHFFMGGVYVNKDHETNINGLFAAGECACIYHGANRLGGNSLLGAIYGGITAAKSASKNEYADGIESAVTEFEEQRAGVNQSLTKALVQGLGIIRSKESINEAINRVDELLQEKSGAERARCLLSKAMLLCALNRKESRGSHFRNDYPDLSEDLAKATAAEIENGEIRISFMDIPKREARP